MTRNPELDPRASRASNAGSPEDDKETEARNDRKIKIKIKSKKLKNMSYATEMKNLVEDIKASTKDRLKFVKDNKKDTQDLLTHFAQELKDMAQNLKHFLNKLLNREFYKWHFCSISL